MILFYLLATIVAICNGQNAEISYQENCFNVLGTLTIQAKYTGTGTPLSVVWSYSAIPGSFLTVLPGSCSIFGGSIPAGFPAGITLKCPATDSLPANTYQLIVSDLLSNESDKTWGVTFTPPVGVAPVVVNLAVPALCTTPSTTSPSTTASTPPINCKCECDCMCRTIVIVGMVFGILGVLGILILVGLLLKGCFDEMKALLVPGVIGIVSDLISLVLSIVVIAKECCGENCEDSECCEEDSECCEAWIDNAAIAFIVIPCVAVVASVVIFVLVKLELIRPGNDAYKAKEAKHPDENHGMTGTSM